MRLQQHTIDVGIDLGTTNSSIAAVIDGKPSIIPNQRNRPTTPSVVRIRTNGALDVGDVAYQQLEFTPGDVSAEFKRAMGDVEAKFIFESSGRTMTPPQLSSEVLESLRADIQHRHELLPRAAVITVPAAFDLAQCAATQEAARLAGFEQAPLLQEPVAASLAYGYANDIASGEWLVYDLGGGTFDLALVGIREGRIAVLDHEGDNFLGGKDLDWLLVERLLIPRLSEQYSVETFARSRPERRAAMAILKTRAEELKVALSASEDATVTIESGRVALLDDVGEEISLDILVTRAEYETAIEEAVSKTLRLCQKVLTRNPQVHPGAVLMVGGTTLTPYIRRRVAEELGVAVDTSADPMTVVAQGAALYAATQPISLGLTSERASETNGGAIRVQLKHATVTEDTEVPVGIQLAGELAYSVEVSAANGSWRSGSIALQKSAAVLRVPLIEKGANQFNVMAFGVQGNVLAVEPSSFVVHRGLTAAAPPLSKSIGVVVRDGARGKSVEWLLKRDTPLPAKATYEFRTTLALEPGGDVEIVGVYFVEGSGESDRPDRNRIVGRIDITDSHVSRTVPAGAPVEVRLNVSASRLLTADVFLPSVDQSFDVAVQMGSEKATVKELTKQVLEEQARLDEYAPHLTAEQMVALQRQAKEVGAAIGSASPDDPGSEQRALNLLKELQTELDKVDERAELPVAIIGGREALSEASSLISAHGSESQQRRIEALSRELDAATATNDVSGIERSTSKIRRLEFEVLGAQPWFWRDWFEYLLNSSQAWTDPEQAESLIRQGKDSLASGDVAGLRHATLRLSSLTPGDEGSFVNVGIRRS